MDYDGTLAPIVADPEAARPDRAALALISELIQMVFQVAIISGRDTDFLARELPLPGLLLIGNHGLEERQNGRSQVVAHAVPYLPAIESAARAVASLPEAQTPGVLLERKRGTLAVHYRQAADSESAARALDAALPSVAAAHGLELRRGRLVYELRPPLPLNKGTVLLRLVDRLRPSGVLVAGDDRTDFDAFAALPAIRDQGISAVAVGVSSSELPATAFAGCDLVVDGVPGVVQVLQTLRDGLRA